MHSCKCKYKCSCAYDFSLSLTSLSQGIPTNEWCCEVKRYSTWVSDFWVNWDLHTEYVPTSISPQMHAVIEVWVQPLIKNPRQANIVTGVSNFLLGILCLDLDKPIAHRWHLGLQAAGFAIFQKRWANTRADPLSFQTLQYFWNKERFHPRAWARCQIR